MPIFGEEYEPRNIPGPPSPMEPTPVPAPPMAAPGSEIVSRLSGPPQASDDTVPPPPPPAPPVSPIRSYIPMSEAGPIGGPERQEGLTPFRSSGFFESLPGRGVNPGTPTAYSPFASPSGGAGGPRPEDDDLVRRILAGLGGG